MSKKQINIVWFRNDLRTQDHPALEAALNSDLPVIGLYCFEPRLYEDYFYGLKKTESFRAQFIIEAVDDLKSNLAKLNIGLKISMDSTVEALKELSDHFDIQSLFYQKEWTTEEVEVENNIKSAFPNLNYQSEFIQFLFHPEDVPFENYKVVPQVFTNFRKACQKQTQVRPIEEILTQDNSELYRF